MTFKMDNKINKYIEKGNDKIEKTSQQNVVYKINGSKSNCGESYVEQTKCALITRHKNSCK